MIYFLKLRENIYYSWSTITLLHSSSMVRFQLQFASNNYNSHKILMAGRKIIYIKNECVQNYFLNSNGQR